VDLLSPGVLQEFISIFVKGAVVAIAPTIAAVVLIAKKKIGQ